MNSHYADLRIMAPYVVPLGQRRSLSGHVGIIGGLTDRLLLLPVRKEQRPGFLVRAAEVIARFSVPFVSLPAIVGDFRNWGDGRPCSILRNIPLFDPLRKSRLIDPSCHAGERVRASVLRRVRMNCFSAIVPCCSYRSRVC